MKTKEFYIDTDLLLKRGACTWGRTKFEAVFPKAATGEKILFTYENWEKARKGRANIGWLAEKALGWDSYYEIETAFKGVVYTNSGFYTKRFGDSLFKAIKEKLEGK